MLLDRDTCSRSIGQRSSIVNRSNPSNSPQTFGYSDEFSFTTPPRVGPDSKVHFIAWADSGQATDDGSDEWEWSDYDPVVTTPSNTTFERLAQIVDVWQQDQVRMQGLGFRLNGLRYPSSMSHSKLMTRGTRAASADCGPLVAGPGEGLDWDLGYRA